MTCADGLGAAKAATPLMIHNALIRKVCQCPKAVFAKKA
jgi:hypothetical protein